LAVFFVSVEVVAEQFAGIRRDPAYERVRAVEAVSPRRRFENLLDRHEVRLRRVAFGMLGDPHRVDDVLQEAFLRAYRGLPSSFESEKHESAWLYRIVYRCCLNELRGRRRRRETPGLPEDASAVEAEASSTDVVAALAQLPPDARAAVLLVDLIGLDYETAAAALRVPRGTVASRLHAGRARLRDALGDRDE
jgi:RNA polymerase sigma-70 factor (ECF subfamily)